MSTDKPLRFAALVRVSTEKQEKKGESLRTQTAQTQAAVAALGGSITRSYAGQEHATANQERELLDRLLADAVRPGRPFDAVVVADATRWSRDNVRSEQGLEILRDAGVRFFVLQTAYDLRNPEARLFLRMTATIGAYHADSQRDKSMRNRIRRARRGIPSSGALPWGRTFDRGAPEVPTPEGHLQGWAVDPDKQAALVDIAERYALGGSLTALAAEHGLTYPLVCRVLRECAGATWTVTFDPDNKLGQRETVVLAVPRLLPEETIRAVRRMSAANSTNHHGRPKHDYLRNGRIFCGGCGYLMTPQESHDRLYYRHEHHGRTRCPYGSPRPQVRADQTETEVVDRLFRMFGNPAAIRRAVAAATPDVSRETKRRARLEKDLAAVGQQYGRLFKFVQENDVADRAEKQLDDLKERESRLRAELAELDAALANVLTEEAVARYVQWLDEYSSWRYNPFGDGTLAESRCVILYDAEGNEVEGVGGDDHETWQKMNRDDRRRLVAAAFPKGQTRLDGTKPGVYVVPARPGTRRVPGRHGHSARWALELRGLLSFDDVMQCARY
jgi:DNA invertase Pin-like site-specific DNA recombinase